MQREVTGEISLLFYDKKNNSERVSRMAFYFFYMTKPKSTWEVALASERQRITKSGKACFVTALDVDNAFTEDLTAEESLNCRYSGDMYFDFDGALDEVLPQVKMFLTKLKAKDVDLDSLKLYLTGGRGVHIEIPMPVFMGVVPKNGVVGLPHIYKECANELYVDTLDLKIFSSGRGRQWRVCNVDRGGGKFKVPVMADEMMAMTVEEYDRLCSSPRNEPPRSTPMLNAEMALMYTIAKDKVEKALQKKKARKVVADPLKKFNGEWPETLLLILNGLGLNPDVGWSSIALQLAITACALGKKEDELIQAADPLINSHTGDSDKYNTPAARRSDLRRRYRHAFNSVTYEFSPGGILSLLSPELRSNSDLRSGDEWQPDEPKKPKAAVTPATEDTPESPAATPTETAEETPEEEEIEEEDETAPVRISKHGIFVRAEDGYKRASQVGLGRVTLLRKLDNSNIGYEVEVFKSGHSQGTHLLGMDKFASRASFQTWTMNWSASMAASDIQTSRIADLLGNRVDKNKDITYVVTREGIDLVVPPGAKSDEDFEIVWASPDQVTGSKGGHYRFRPAMADESQFKSDLMSAPLLTTEDEKLVDCLLNMNSTQNMAKLLGWFSAAFMCQLFRRFYSKQFPSLQVFGQAGAGKSKSVGVCSHLHYFMRDPKVFQSVGQTQFPILAAVSSSASQVVLFEELKSREMNKGTRDFLLNILRCNYDATDIARGAISRDKASRDTVVNNYGNSGPVAFVGEALESQSAMLERCILVSLSKDDRYGKSEHFHYVEEHCTGLGKLGKAMALSVMATEVSSFRGQFKEVFQRVKMEAGELGEDKERPVFNIAVTVMGLDLLRKTLHAVFGERFDERLDELRDSMLNHVIENIPNNMSEASRVLDVIASLTRSFDEQYRIAPGVDYTISADGKTVDLKLRTAYTKYVRWQRSLGMEVLFDNENAFVAGMANYGGTIKRACVESVLHDSPRAIVYRLSVEYMDKEGVDGFKTKEA